MSKVALKPWAWEVFPDSLSGDLYIFNNEFVIIIIVIIILKF